MTVNFQRLVKLLLQAVVRLVVAMEVMQRRQRQPEGSSLQSASTVLEQEGVEVLLLD